MNDVKVTPQSAHVRQMEGEDYENLRKTKVRRLYDIANILQAIQLITKTVDADNRPAFKWIGLRGLLSYSEELYSALSLITTDESE